MVLIPFFFGKRLIEILGKDEIKDCCSAKKEVDDVLSRLSAKIGQIWLLK